MRKMCQSQQFVTWAWDTGCRLLSQCLISNREGLGTSLLIMGLATIDPHSRKV